MNRLPARIFTRMHSPKWRRQYGDEFEALLLDLPPSAPIVFDVLLSICVSRQREVNVAMAAVAIVLLASMASPYRHSPNATTTIHRETMTRVAIHTNSPCRTYSSVARNAFVQQHRCLG